MFLTNSGVVRQRQGGRRTRPARVSCAFVANTKGFDFLGTPVTPRLSHCLAACAITVQRYYVGQLVFVHVHVGLET